MGTCTKTLHGMHQVKINFDGDVAPVNKGNLSVNAIVYYTYDAQRQVIRYFFSLKIDFFHTLYSDYPLLFPFPPNLTSHLYPYHLCLSLENK